MNLRRNLIAAAGCVLLLVMLLVPLAQLLMRSADTLLDQKQTEIARALEMERERAALSPYTPVQPAPDIETIWAIEDARTETDEPLVTSMRCSTGEAGYDAGSRTFYATLGMDTGDEWPEITLSARGAENVQVLWIDDYSYDWCSDAIREGYRYELLAYTDTRYAYIGVVFTGLPIVNVYTENQQELTREDIAARVSIAAGGYEAIDAPALVHRRGGRFDDHAPKASFHVEFHQLSEKGKDKKPKLSVLGMEADSDWLLISHEGDPSCMRNKLAFDMWRRWNPDGNAFAMLESRMVEVFYQNEYMGLYQLIQRIRPEQELARMGDRVDRNIAVRLIGGRYETGRPVSQISLPIDGCMELRYAPAWMKEDAAFARLEDYVTLNLSEGSENWLDDEAFAQLALERVDIRELMSYYLYMNVCSLPYDNVKNNVYIWVRWNEDQYMYSLSPWDMDSGFRPLFTDGSDSINLWMVLPVRMLELNVGNCREVFKEVFEEKRAELLTEDALYQWIEEEEEIINASGAYLRESARWQGGAQELDLSEVFAHTASQMHLIERYIQGVWPVAGMTPEE